MLCSMSVAAGLLNSDFEITILRGYILESVGSLQLLGPATWRCMIHVSQNICPCLDVEQSAVQSRNHLSVEPRSNFVYRNTKV